MVDISTESLSSLLRSIKPDIPSADDPDPVVIAKPEENVEVAVVRKEEVTSVVTPKNIFRHPEAHPLVLDLMLIKKYGEEWLGWEQETIEHRVPLDFGIDRISDINMGKLNAMKALHLVDTFWERWEVFGWCTIAINATFPDFVHMQVPTVMQAAIAVDVANRIRSDVTWSSEVSGFIATVHRHDGFLVPQPPLDFVVVDTSDLPINIEEVKKAWPAVRTAKVAPNTVTPEAEQLRRMLFVLNAVEHSRTQLQQQLGALRHE
jgi:hypothetical protein